VIVLPRRWTVVLTGHDNRPHLFHMSQCSQLTVDGIYLYNSPQYHVRPTQEGGGMAQLGGRPSRRASPPSPR
jgi:hypothetical protein